MNDFDAKNITSKKKAPPTTPKIFQEAVKDSTTEKTPKPITVASKVPIPTGKRTQNIASSSNKRAKVEGVDSTTLLAAQKRERCDDLQ